MREPIVLDGHSLSPELLVTLSKGDHSIDLSDDAWLRVRESRSVIDAILTSGQVVYGVNTGFGMFSDVVIAQEDLSTLQLNLIRSHAAGVGAPLTAAQTRMLLALRVNVLARGHSGIRPNTLKQMLDAFNNDCLSVIPSQGTVGASGDLAPLAHLALGLLGEGKMWDEKFTVHKPANDVLAVAGLKPITLEAKEGLALINGTQFITAIGAEAVVRSQNVLYCADIACALTLECLKGTPVAFDPRIHAARSHPGQINSATRIRSLLSDGNPLVSGTTAVRTDMNQTSELFRSHNYRGKVQDAYSLRCAPQVHGIAEDTLNFARTIIQTECNASTDNPMVFAEESEILSGGNFHGEYPAKVLDFLAIAISELGTISERRIERLVNPQLSGLPAFLVKQGGLNSGFMITHCTAAALVSENKVLCHPASSDSISTSAAKEDHVSMGGFAARKALQILTNVETIIAIEILAACQALEFHRPLKTTHALERLHTLIRSHVPALDEDRSMAPDIDKVTELVRAGAVVGVVKDRVEVCAE